MVIFRIYWANNDLSRLLIPVSTYFSSPLCSLYWLYTLNFGLLRAFSSHCIFSNIRNCLAANSILHHTILSYIYIYSRSSFFFKLHRYRHTSYFLITIFPFKNYFSYSWITHFYNSILETKHIQVTPMIKCIQPISPSTPAIGVSPWTPKNIRSALHCTESILPCLLKAHMLDP